MTLTTDPDLATVTFIRRPRRRIAPVCPVDGCSRTRPSRVVVCRRCWAGLPATLRRQIYVDWEAWRAARTAWRADPAIDQAVVDDLRDRYHATRDTAINAAALNQDTA